MSRKTFGGWGFVPDPEWGAHIVTHTPSCLRGGEGKGGGRGGM